MAPVGGDSALHRIDELERRPATDAILVWRDVGHTKQAERRIELESAAKSQLVSAFCSPTIDEGRVTGCATAGPENALPGRRIRRVLRQIGRGQWLWSRQPERCQQ